MCVLKDKRYLSDIKLHTSNSYFNCCWNVSKLLMVSNKHLVELIFFLQVDNITRTRKGEVNNIPIYRSLWGSLGISFTIEHSILKNRVEHSDQKQFQVVTVTEKQ